MAQDLGGIDTSKSLGPIYWGVVFSLLLGGISIVQSWTYFQRNKDPLFVRTVAWIMFIFDLGSTALVVQSVYYYIVPHFGSLVPIENFTPSLAAECSLSTSMTMISQAFFARQLYIVLCKGGRWNSKVPSCTIPVIVGLLTALAFIFGIACTVAMFVHHSGVLSSDKAHMFSVYFGLAKGFGAATDIVATLAMIIYLGHAKGGITETNSLISSLIRFIMERGALVTLIQTLLLVTFFAAPNHIYWLPIHVNVTKLYANTFFAMLNARTNLHAGDKGYRGAEVRPLSSMVASDRHGFPNFDAEAGSFDSKRKGSSSITAMPTVTKSVVLSYA